MSKDQFPEGVSLLNLKMNTDSRGVFTELYRASNVEQFGTVQWNHVTSNARVLRGVHVHKKHFDYLTVISGRGFFGLHDLRQNSITSGLSTSVILSARELQVLIIPPGVAHGFYFFEPSMHLYAVSEYWNLDDELGCHFLSEKLKIDWPDKNPFISERDVQLPSYDELLRKHSF